MTKKKETTTDDVKSNVLDPAEELLAEFEQKVVNRVEAQLEKRLAELNNLLETQAQRIVELEKETKVLSKSVNSQSPNLHRKALRVGGLSILKLIALALVALGLVAITIYFL